MPSSANSAFSTWAAIAILMAMFHAVFVQSQTGQSPQTTAECGNTYLWTFNNMSQSPCLVAAYLQAMCFPDQTWTVEALRPGEIYLPPNATTVNACQCNTVTYNMLSACANCQQNGWVGFKDWIGSCPSGIVQVGEYPFNIPDGTIVPMWAFIDSSKGTWDAVASYSMISSSPGGITAAEPIIPGTPPRKGLSAGPIAAIVCGIVALLLLLLAFAFFRYRGVRSSYLSTAGNGKGRYSSIHPTSMTPSHQSSRASLVPSSRPDASFVQDKASAPNRLSMDLTAMPRSMENSPGTPWSAIFTRKSPHVIQQEDLGSAAGFTFVSSEGGSRATAPTTSLPPSTQAPATIGQFGASPHPLSHQYPPRPTSLGDASTLYPSDSISNLQFAEYSQRNTIVDLSAAPQKLSRRAVSEADRKQEEAETLAELAALEGSADHGSPSGDSLSTRTFSPPPHRSRLGKIPASAPVMMYPDMVRGNFTG